MTAYIVQVTQGNAGYGTTIYYSIYAVGFTLFLFTLVMNLIAVWISPAELGGVWMNVELALRRSGIV